MGLPSDLNGGGGTMKSLPDLPSELIRVALADLAWVEAQPETYEVNMTQWHHPDDGPCVVCLAGSVMAHTLGSKPSDDLGPNQFSDDIKNKLSALNWFRMGNIDFGLECMRIPHPADLADNRKVVEYDQDPVLFREQITNMITYLEGFGL